MPYEEIDVRPVTPTLGAEIHGVDLSKPLGNRAFSEIHDALIEHQVIFFRDQAMTPAQQLSFARRWGEIHLHPYMQGMDDYPEILEIVKTPQDKKNFGGSWHSDQMFGRNQHLWFIEIKLRRFVGQQDPMVRGHQGITLWQAIAKRPFADQDWLQLLRQSP